ncbi:hypothetical protein K227x_33730 [Rubripirellula lacrimiformis]|uniref:Uncharacterized protein n=1 Tax=Rubripirellula lacrimiformis TaxID=1930273 RepID=A0A517NCW4_9BACT|nr:hypothetical protein [Rubripirellula lacrimiformis]QDT04975.1 hypothetical protein K227x_33730 [Rubripirellula lacrimiformis]
MHPDPAVNVAVGAAVNVVGLDTTDGVEYVECVVNTCGADANVLLDAEHPPRQVAFCALASLPMTQADNADNTITEHFHPNFIFNS